MHPGLPSVLAALAAITASLLASAIVQAARTRWALRGLPLARAPRSWLLGHVPALSGDDFHDVLIEWGREVTGGCGDFAVATPLGGRGLVAAAPGTVDAALGARGRGAGAGPALPKYRVAFAQLNRLWPGGAASVFTCASHGAASAPAWKPVRAALVATLTAAHSKAAVPIATAAAAEMAADLEATARAAPSAATSFDAADAGLRLALASVGAHTLGLSASASLSAPEPAAVATLPAALAHVQACMSNPFAALSLSPSARQGRRAIAGYRAVVTAAAAAAAPPPGSPGEAILSLALPPAQLAAEVGGLIMGGFETVGNALSFALCEAAASAGVCAALTAELSAAGLLATAAAPTPRLPTAADLARLPYTAAVVKEALRLHPVVPATPREAPPGGAVLAGTRLPARTFVLVLLKAAAVDADAWGADAGEFRPERWLESGERPPSWPFGAGPRGCPGALLAHAVAVAALATLWARLDITAAARPLREAVTLTAHPVAGHRTLIARMRAGTA